MGSIHDMDICWIFAICSVAIVDIWLWLMMIYIVTMLGFQPKSPTMKVLHGAARLLVRAASCDVATSERCFQLQGWADTAGTFCLIMNKGGTNF